MNHFRSTERHLTLLKIPCGVLKEARVSGNAGSGGGMKNRYANRKQSFSNHVVSRYTRGARTIKLREVMQTRLLTNNSNIPLLNPGKLNPEEASKNIVTGPIVPLTLPRFPKNNSSDKLPSVTKILQATMPASSQFLLDRWKEAMVKKLGFSGFIKYQQDTFERGKLLHAVIANYLLGQGGPTELSKEIVSNLWKSVENVVKDKISNVRLVEHIVTHSDLKYRGIVDCVAFYQDELVVIDFKTAEKPKKTVESLFDNPLQVTAYCGAINNDRSIPKHVIDRNICSALVIVAYVDGTEASVYYLGREKILNDYWKQWTNRLDQYSRMEEMKHRQSGNTDLQNGTK